MKTLRMIGAAVVAVVLGAGVCACDDDDDDGNDNNGSGGSSPKTGVSVITTSNGEELLLTALGSMRFSYDSQGRCTSATGGEADYEMSYDPFKVTADYENQCTLSLSFNSSGYVSKITYSYVEHDLTEGGTVNLSYDSDGHLTKASETYSGEDDESGWDGTATGTFTWKSGDMTSAEITYKYVDTKYGTCTSTDEWTCEYSDTENEYRQVTKATNDVLEISEIAFLWDLGLIGYFGKGTAHLATSYNEVYAENAYGDHDSYTYSNSFSYTKNGDGTIATEKRGSTTFRYSYKSLDSGAGSEDSTLDDDISSMWFSSERDKAFTLRPHHHHNR